MELDIFHQVLKLNVRWDVAVGIATRSDWTLGPAKPVQRLNTNIYIYIYIYIYTGEYKLSEYFVPVAVCTGAAAVVSVEFCLLWSPHRFPGAESESFTHSVDRLFGNTWPSHATLSLMTDASSVTKLFIPPSD
jgi:hypothetical protein